MTRALVALAVAFTVGVACTPGERAVLDTAGRDLDKVCAERAALRDGGLTPLIVSNGCDPDASTALLKCVGIGVPLDAGR